MSAPKLLLRRERRAEYHAEPRATRGPWWTRARYQNDGPDNRASRRERLALAKKAYLSGEWVVELGRALRAFAISTFTAYDLGDRGVVPEPKPPAANTWTFAAWGLTTEQVYDRALLFGGDEAIARALTDHLYPT